MENDRRFLAAKPRLAPAFAALFILIAMSYAGTKPSTAPFPSAALRRVRLFGIEIDAVRMDEAVDRILAWTESPQNGCRYVVTPNVDHAVMYQHRDDLRQAYRDAALILADGLPVVLASRLVGKRLPERVAGSDLAPALFTAVSPERKLTVFLLGAASGVGEAAAEKIHACWPNVEVVGTYSPPRGFENDEAENSKILDIISAASPNVLLIGLGAPKQELWVQRHRERLQVPAALCVGATIDFLAGARRRAPIWMRKTGLEWLHRACSEPRRLLTRYARDAWVFPQLVWQEIRGREQKNDS